MARAEQGYNISFGCDVIGDWRGGDAALDTAPMLQRTPIVADRARPRALAYWLLAVAVMIVGMVVLGGITRLTESGLSITEWDPISGIIPPLTHAAWIAEFDHYKRIPEYTEINRNMDLAGFKAIFFW